MTLGPCGCVRLPVLRRRACARPPFLGGSSRHPSAASSLLWAPPASLVDAEHRRCGESCPGEHGLLSDSSPPCSPSANVPPWRSPHEYATLHSREVLCLGATTY